MVITNKVPIELKFTLSALRHRSGLKQSDLASLLKVNLETYRKLEKDSADLSVKQIDMIEEFYRVPRDYIFFGRDTDLIGKINKEA
ncbi:helix-turn-helix transcriptional regulator [Marinilactibacillus sp. XAAS-LB27]|uniref:helix-turn-helix transcriptional regulator n=1 Tax=Marinilactibacillus sp. XAAS-LB27 TaxID=3114538 RepID=UPI002E1964F7|nr:helix-turn-helix transcriptional regulator [Marinilactibacillus sp. XAAS-LB27]